MIKLPPSPKIVLSCNLRVTSRPVEQIISLLSNFQDQCPELFPTSWGFLEEQNPLISIEEIASKWEMGGIFMRRQSPSLYFSMLPLWPRVVQNLNVGLGLFDDDTYSLEALERLLHVFTSFYPCHFGCLSRPAAATRQVAKLTGAVGFVALGRLRNYIPDLYWTTVFGAQYVKLFGRDRLLSTSAYKTEELAHGAILIQITPDINDVETNTGLFLAARERVKREICEDAFFQYDPTQVRESISPADFAKLGMQAFYTRDGDHLNTRKWVPDFGLDPPDSEPGQNVN